MLSFLLPLSLILGACEDEDSKPPDDSGETGDSGEAISWTVGAYDPNLDMAAVAGVAIAFDFASGERVEVVTGADGTATLELVPAELLSAISHKDGYSVVWVSGALLRESFETYGSFGFYAWDLTPEIPPAPERPPVLVSGALLNKADDESAALVCATWGSCDEEPAGALSYVVEVQADAPFTLVGLEFVPDPYFPDLDGDQVIEDTFLGWTLLASEALSEDTTLDLDFGDAVAPVQLSGSLVAPAGRIATEGAAGVTVYGAGTVLGLTPHTWAEADQAAFGFELEYVALSELAPTDYTTLVETLTNDGLYSAVTLEGSLPEEGERDYGLLAPPERTSPEGEGPFAWTTSISWEPLEGSADEAPYIGLYGNEGQIGAAVVTAEESALALTALPSSSTTLTGGAIYALTMRCGTLDEDPNCEKVAFGTGFELESPLAD